jgi:hypothetical protein
LGYENTEFILKKFCFLFFILIGFSNPAFPFTADYVQIMRLDNGKYRVLIDYTNLTVGEYRQAFVDFDKKADAIKAFTDLAKGADFYLGKKNTIEFRKDDEKVNPY